MLKTVHSDFDEHLQQGEEVQREVKGDCETKGVARREAKVGKEGGGVVE